MTELFIDDMPAVVSQNVNIKLTTENAYFTKSTSYTYDVELPLSIVENRKIFGPISRLDVEKEQRRIAAKLVVDNVPVLIGEAHITSVNEDSVKIQLLGEAASYNYGNKVNDTYIDQMDLGDWYFETWPDGSYMYRRGWKYYESETEVGSTLAVHGRAYYKGPDHGSEQYSKNEVIDIMLRGDFGWVAYPTYNQTAGMRHNAIAFEETSGLDYAPYIREYEGECRKGRTEVEEQAKASFSIQPFVWKIAEIIAKRTGFVLEKTDNALFTDDFFNKIFIVNTSTASKIKTGLPHWTVNEFWTQIEHTFGVVLRIDYSAKKMSIQRRRDHYQNAKTNTIKNVVEKYETTIDDDTQHDLSVDNVGYAECECNPEDRLTDEILSNTLRMRFDTLSDVLAWGEQQPEIYKFKNVIFECADGRQFIYSTNVNGDPGFIEVNMLRPRITDPEEDVEIELRIVPARYCISEADIFVPSRGKPGAATNKRDIPDGTFEVRMLRVPGNEATAIDDDDENFVDIQATIEDEEDVSVGDTTQNLMYIAIALQTKDIYETDITLAGGRVITPRLEYPRAILRERSFVKLGGESGCMDEGCSLSLIPIPGKLNFAKKTIEGHCSIKTNVRYYVKFVDKKMPNPEDLFLIRNKLYVCEKIEATITPEGLDPLMSGYFYEFVMD